MFKNTETRKRVPLPSGVCMNDQIWLKVRYLVKLASWLSQNVCPTVYTSSIARDTSLHSVLPPLSFHKHTFRS